MALLQPKKTKYKKYHKRLTTLIVKNYFKKELIFGTFGLKASEPGRLSARQIEATRKIIKKITKRTGILSLNIFPQVPITSKPSETRMGKGKGTISYWASFVKKSTIILELTGISKAIALKALKMAATKLPIKTIIIYQTK